MSESRHPYIRPQELGSSDTDYTLRIVQDGTRTVAEVYEGPAEELSFWSKPIGVGHAVRRKGDRRDPSLGATLAMARAFKNASENAFDAVKDKLSE